MKILLKLVGFLILLLVALVCVGFTFDSKFNVERSIVINAPADKIFPAMADVKRWQEWGPWYERDPKMQITYTPSTDTVGATSSWKSSSQGNGSAKLTKLDAPKMVEYELSFEGFDRPSTGSYVLEPQGNATKVRWIMAGDVGASPINRWFCKFMDKMVGPDFEAGLAKLKKNMEK